MVLPQAGFNALINDQDLHLSDTETLSPKLLNEARLGLSWKHTTQKPFSNAPALQVAGAFTGGGSAAQDLDNRERDIEIGDNLFANIGKHALKIGAQAVVFAVRDFNPNTFNGSFIFGGGLAPQLDAGGQPISSTNTAITGLEQYRRALRGLPGGVPTAYTVTRGMPLVSVNQWQIAAYVQDQWRLHPRLSLSLGLRYAAQTAPANLGSWAPRVGVAWSPDAKQRWLIHARAGLFYDSIDLGTTLEAYRLSGGSGQRSVTVYEPSFKEPLANGVAVDTVRQFAPNIKPSPSFQGQLGLERELPKHWHLQTNMVWIRGWDTLRSANVNAPILTSALSDPLTAPRPRSSDGNILQFQNTGSISGPVGFLGLSQSGYRRFRLFVGYLYFDLHSDADTPTLFPQSSYSKQGDQARPSWESTNRVFVVGSFNLPGKIDFNTYLDSASGLPYNVTTGLDNNRDGIFNDRPTLAQQPSPAAYPTQFGLLTAAGINGNLSRNVGTMPWTIHWDATLSRSFPIESRKDSQASHQSLELDARASNLLNHTNVTAVNNVLGPALGRPLTAEFGRRVELGIRYSF